jgi:hypothetical protein
MTCKQLLKFYLRSSGLAGIRPIDTARTGEVMLGASLPSSQAVMKIALQPWHLLACIVAGYANRE